MDKGRRDRVDDVFQDALDLALEERRPFVERACAGDEDLSRAVRRLLASHERAEADGFIEGPVLQVAEQLAASEAGLPPGHSVGPYKVVRPLGAGGMGDVYLAHDTRLNRHVALKVLSARLTTDEERVRRFRREALAASALNHPNILTIYEIGESRGRDFIATEYVEGVTLRRRMRGRWLSLAASLDFALQVAGALAAAHGAGIVHRDIKPENVMVRPDGLVKVLDFGIAKYAEPARRRGSKESWIKTATGVVIGTTAYMSPEQARGQAVDARTDVWSLGVILYEMVARQLPFPGKTPTDRVAAILEREPEPLGRLRRGVPAELDRIVGRALAKNRDERYAQTADFAADLRKLRATLGEERPFRFALPAPAGALLLSRKRSAVAWAALLLVIAAAIAAPIYYLRPGAGATAIDSLAVLPFVNAGGSANTEYLPDGITDSLINSLSQLPNLKVMSRSSVFRYKGQELDARAVGTTLGVRAVLTGRVVQRGDDLFVSLELVDARDSSHLWGGQYSRKMADLVALQSEITQDVSRNLRARLSGADEQRLAKNYTENSEAYQLYLKGRYFWNKKTPGGHQKGIEYFNQAIEKDPTYALAFVGLADAYLSLPNDSDAPPRETYPKAKAAATRALAVDGGLAEAHASLAWVKFKYEWDFPGAEEGLKRAISLNPNYHPEVYQRYARYLSSMGRHEEAIAEAKRARELDPLSLSLNNNVGQALLWARQYEGAIEEARKALEIDPNFWVAHLFLGKAYEQKGMYPEAVTALQKAKELSGGSSEATSMIGYVYAVSGRRDEALRVLNELRELSKQRYVSPSHIAMVYAGLGDKEQVYLWLEKAYEDRSQFMTNLKVEPKFDGLRSDPRFTDLMRRVGLSR